MMARRLMVSVQALARLSALQYFSALRKNAEMRRRRISLSLGALSAPEVCAVVIVMCLPPGAC
jgi:hypothetical protein